MKIASDPPAPALAPLQPAIHHHLWPGRAEQAQCRHGKAGVDHRPALAAQQRQKISACSAAKPASSADGIVSASASVIMSDGDMMMFGPETCRDFRFVVNRKSLPLAALKWNFRSVCCRQDLEHLSASDTTVIALGWYEAIVLATDEAVRFRTCHVWTVGGGQIKRFEQIADTLAIARALQS
jgi:ketosteroid isomerase-like protein